MLMLEEKNLEKNTESFSSHKMYMYREQFFVSLLVNEKCLQKTAKKIAQFIKETILKMQMSMKLYCLKVA